MSEQRTLKKPTAIIFDMDGLLVDSEPIAKFAWQTAAADCGFALPDEFFLTLIGCGAEDAERALAARVGPSFDAAAFRHRRGVLRQQRLDAGPVPLKPGAREMIAFVQSVGLPFGLATSSSLREVREQMGSLADVFAAVATRDDVTRAKPSPDLYLIAAKGLGVPPGECLALEDSLPGVRSAVAAGMAVLMVPDMIPPTAEIAAMTEGVYPSLFEVSERLAREWGVPGPLGS